MSRKKLLLLKQKTVIENPFQIESLKSEVILKAEYNPVTGELIKSDDLKISKQNQKDDGPSASNIIQLEASGDLKTSSTAQPSQKTEGVSMQTPKINIQNKSQIMKSNSIEVESEKLSKQFPFRVGEKISYSVRYFALEAGHFSFEVKPTKQIQGKPVFHFYVTAKTSSVFAWVYSLKDFAESFWDMSARRPFLMKIYGEESRFLREVQTSFDWKKKEARYRAKIMEIGKGLDEEDKTWGLKHTDSQDVVSALYYLRTKDLKVGQTYDFRIAERGKDILVKASVLREEVVSTKIGKFDTFVIQPKFSVDGAWKQKGDVTLWLTKDQYKTPIQFDAKIKVGTIKGRLQSLIY